ncbi:hypothetical protein Cgig2_021867 [Carnegiea gigantea]|uniref:Uncharacterized protein n=1 Tax=Carnegiea gigantea TaxID=171969 RepID=A0A9Q1Q7D3_9CARY|nr:hypothetical protein Cgig2_021867 [Carnegiea gigantea]
MGHMFQEGDTEHTSTGQGEQFGGGGLGANSDVMHEAGDDFWDYIVEPIDESLFIASGNQVNQPSPSQAKEPMLSVILHIPVCTKPIGNVCDLTPPEPLDGSYGIDVIIEPEDEGDFNKDDEEEFEMEDEEQSKSESSGLASIVDEDEIFDSDSGDEHDTLQNVKVKTAVGGYMHLFFVMTIKGSHGCKRLFDNPAATYRWIASKLFENVRANPNMSVKGIRNALMKKYYL